MQPQTQHWIQTVTVLAGGGGFIVTSLLWSTVLAHLIDGRVRPVVATLAAGIRIFLVWRHSFSLAFQSDPVPRGRDRGSSKPRVEPKPQLSKHLITGRPLTC